MDVQRCHGLSPGVHFQTHVSQVMKVVVLCEQIVGSNVAFPQFVEGIVEEVQAFRQERLLSRLSCRASSSEMVPVIPSLLRLWKRSSTWCKLALSSSVTLARWNTMMMHVVG